MSAIGSGPAAYGLPASIAGAQRNSADADRVKADQAQQSRQVQQDRQAEGDVDETNLSSDRDADGRQPFVLPGNPAAEDDVQPPSDGQRRGRDAEGARGGVLDLDA